MLASCYCNVVPKAIKLKREKVYLAYGSGVSCAISSGSMAVGL